MFVKSFEERVTKESTSNYVKEGLNPAISFFEKCEVKETPSVELINQIATEKQDYFWKLQNEEYLNGSKKFEISGKSIKPEKLRDFIELEHEEDIIKLIKHCEVASKKPLNDKRIIKDCIEFDGTKFVVNESKIESIFRIYAETETEIKAWNLINDLLKNLQELQKIGFKPANFERLTFGKRVGPFFIIKDPLKTREIVLSGIENLANGIKMIEK